MNNYYLQITNPKIIVNPKQVINNQFRHEYHFTIHFVKSHMWKYQKLVILVMLLLNATIKYLCIMTVFINSVLSLSTRLLAFVSRKLSSCIWITHFCGNNKSNFYWIVLWNRNSRILSLLYNAMVNSKTLFLAINNCKWKVYNV